MLNVSLTERDFVSETSQGSIDVLKVDKVVVFRLNLLES